MKSNTIYLGLYGNPKNVERISGHWRADHETKQIATYSISEGIATITDLTPLFGFAKKLNLPMPFLVPVNDLGSGLLGQIDVNCDTLTAHLAVCPTAQWADRRALPTTVPTIQQQLAADYCALL